MWLKIEISDILRGTFFLLGNIALSQERSDEALRLSANCLGFTSRVIHKQTLVPPSAVIPHQILLWNDSTE